MRARDLSATVRAVMVVDQDEPEPDARNYNDDHRAKHSPGTGPHRSNIGRVSRSVRITVPMLTGSRGGDADIPTVEAELTP